MSTLMVAPSVVPAANSGTSGSLIHEHIEQVLVGGDLSKLSTADRLSYYNAVCKSLGLNPLTKPFAYITLNGKLTLYALKDATEQLRKLHGVSITEITSQRLEDVFVVTAKAQDRDGRTDAATGAVAIGNLKGEALANALMKAETKAKRRATLSICGLGILDETEAETLAPLPTVVVSEPARVALPDGTWQIVSTTPKQWGGEIAVVDAAGEETIYPVPDTQCFTLCEQLAQEGKPVTLTLVTGARDGKVKVKAAHRYAAVPEPEDAAGFREPAKDLPF